MDIFSKIRGQKNIFSVIFNQIPKYPTIILTFNTNKITRQ